jgi:hypothetical protein
MVTRVPSAVRTRMMRARGLGSGVGAGAAALRVTGAGLAWRVLRAAAVDCAAAAGDAVDGGRATADAPPHAATTQAPASALAARNVCLIMLPSMRRLPPAVVRFAHWRSHFRGYWRE